MTEPLPLDDLSPHARDAIDTPTTVFDASTDSSEGRTPGLILTKEQIISLRRYELTGLKLPTELRDVQNYLGFLYGADEGLNPKDFQKSFIMIKTHAQRWDPLRAKIKLVGSQLKLYAGDMQIYGAAMEDVYEDIKQLKVLVDFKIRTMEDVKKLQLELGDKFPGIELDADDKETVDEFNVYLGKIFKGVEQRLKEADDIKIELDSFGRDLENSVLPEIKAKVHLIDISKLGPEIQVLDARIKERSEQIAEKDKAYSDAVNKSIGSAFGGVAGLAMAIYTGVEAEKIRKARNALKKEQTKDIQLLQTKQHILAQLHRVKLDMQDLEMVAVDASAATHNLRTVWNALHLYIKTSFEATKECNDALLVRAFMTEFRRVVAPWVYIEKDAGLLLDVFAAADEQMKLGNGDNQ
ncbi:MAG: hypothetical protein JWP80_2371 [Pseudomonas sp.]|nr:hypothetical protein [Pseudomonas sp.]